MANIMKFTWTIEYDEGDAQSAQYYINGLNYYLALWNFSQKLRSHYKYGDYEGEVFEMIEKIRADLYECMENEGIDL